MKFKRSFKSARQRDLTEKYLKNNIKNETTKIDLEKVKNNDSELEMVYHQFSKFRTHELIYKIKNEELSSIEKKVIKQILNERR